MKRVIHTRIHPIWPDSRPSWRIQRPTLRNFGFRYSEHLSSSTEPHHNYPKQRRNSRFSVISRSIQPNFSTGDFAMNQTEKKWVMHCSLTNGLIQGRESCAEVGFTSSKDRNPEQRRDKGQVAGENRAFCARRIRVRQIKTHR